MQQATGSMAMPIQHYQTQQPGPEQLQAVLTMLLWDNPLTSCMIFFFNHSTVP